MKNIIFIAPPAAGKGTQSDLLVKKYGYHHISTGDLLRSEVASKSELGNEIASIMSSGNLVSDEIVTKVLEKKLSEIKEPYIFDGYPRNMVQAKILEDILTKLNKHETIAIYLNVSEEEAIKRATGRLSCPNCNRSYHKYTEEVKPKVSGKCDDCEVDLINRDDDSEETYRVRYKNYIDNASPLLNYYQDKEMLYVVENPIYPNTTFIEIENVISDIN